MKIYWDGNAKNIIGPKIKKLRKAANLTQEGLCLLYTSDAADD